jgi:hypothetical protein
MKIVFLLLPLFLFSTGFQSVNHVKENNPELDAFIAQFKAAALAKDKVQLMALMDPAYKMEQHDKFKQGNTESFLNELFCGYKIDQNGFKCIPIKKLRSIDLATQGDDGAEISLVFRVGDKKDKIDVLLVAIMRMVDGVKVYGIRGAVG